MRVMVRVLSRVRSLKEVADRFFCMTEVGFLNRLGRSRLKNLEVKEENGDDEVSNSTNS